MLNQINPEVILASSGPYQFAAVVFLGTTILLGLILRNYARQIDELRKDNDRDRLEYSKELAIERSKGVEARYRDDEKYDKLHHKYLDVYQALSKCQGREELFENRLVSLEDTIKDLHVISDSLVQYFRMRDAQLDKYFERLSKQLEERLLVNEQASPENRDE